MFLTAIFSVYSVINFFIGKIVIGIIFLCIITFFAVIFAISAFKGDIFCKLFEKIGVKSPRIFCAILLATAFLFSGLSALSFQKNTYRDFEDNHNHTVTGYVKEYSKDNDDVKILLSDVNIDGKNYAFNIQLSTNKVFDVGDTLTFVSNLYPTKLVDDGKIYTYVLKLNLHYYASADGDNVIFAHGNAKFVDKIKDNSKKILLENFDEENAGFAYAVLFGDKSLLSTDYYSIFKNAGLAHILAVSGLHISFLVALVSFILKKLKVKNKVQFLVIFAVLLFYNIICNFSPSVFRASVMSLCLLLGLVLGERNDSMSNMGLAGVVVLLLQPIYLFDVGFLLSFSSVLGIFMFSRLFEKLFDRIKFPKFLSSSLAITLSATIGTLPWICKYFKEFAIVSFVSNLLVLPIFSIMFVVLLISVFINLILPVNFLLIASEFLVNIVVSLSRIFARFGTIHTINFDTLSAFIYYIVCVFASHFCIMTKKSKLVCVLSVSLLFSTTIATCNTKSILKTDVVLATHGMKNSLLFNTKTHGAILAGMESNETSKNQTKNLIDHYNINCLNYIFVFNYDDRLEDNIAFFANTYTAKNVVIFAELSAGQMLGLTNKLYTSSIVSTTDRAEYEIDDNFKFELTYAELQYTDGVCAVSYKVNKKNILQTIYALSQNQIVNGFCGLNYKLLYSNNYVARYTQIWADSYVCQRIYSTNEESVVHKIQRQEMFEYQI